MKPHLRALYQAAFRFCGHPQDAEDLFQELLIRLYQKLDQWVDLPEPRAWLFKVLYHLHIDRVRRKDSTQGQQKQEVSLDLVADYLFADTTSCPESAAVQQSRQERISKALDQLNLDQRLLVVLHLMEGFTLEETAGILNVPLGTLKSRLHRSKEKLKAALQLDWMDLGNNSNNMVFTEEANNELH